MNESGSRQAIELHLREVRQLFDAMDPSPFREKDLDPNAEEYIVDSLKEIPARAAHSLTIYFDSPTGVADETQAIGDAVRAHFARKSQLLRRDLRRLLHRGTTSLMIGIGFLAALFTAASFIPQWFSASVSSALVREGLLIGGWVAMWRPLEIFLYDWWPIVGEVRIYDHLRQIDVRIVQDDRVEPDDLTKVLTRRNAAWQGSGR